MSESILEEAQRLIHGPRNKNYGHPRENFADIAALFSAYLGQEVTDLDVANLMILVKIARVKGTGYHRDSFTDIAGYAGCVERIYEEPLKAPATVYEPVDPNATRMWDSLDEVPKDVRVRSAGDCRWRFWQPGETDEYGNIVSSEGEWLWSSASGDSYDKTPPFAEILARHDQKESA